MWKLIKFRKNVIFSRNHTDVNPDDWTITKKTIRTTIHENFSKMKNLKVDRWALSLISIDYMYSRPALSSEYKRPTGSERALLRLLALLLHVIATSHTSHNALEKYPTIKHVHISVTKWCIMGHGTDALWDLCNRSLEINWTRSDTSAWISNDVYVTMGCNCSSMYGWVIISYITQ